MQALNSCFVVLSQSPCPLDVAVSDPRVAVTAAPPRMESTVEPFQIALDGLVRRRVALRLPNILPSLGTGFGLTGQLIYQQISAPPVPFRKDIKCNCSNRRPNITGGEVR